MWVCDGGIIAAWVGELFSDLNDRLFHAEMLFLRTAEAVGARMLLEWRQILLESMCVPPMWRNSEADGRLISFAT